MVHAFDLNYSTRQIPSPGILIGLHNIVLNNTAHIPLQSKEECEYLIELAKPHMHKSTVVDSATGRSKDSRCDSLIVIS